MIRKGEASPIRIQIGQPYREVSLPKENMDNYQLVTPIEILLVEDSPSDADLTIETLTEGKVLNNLYVVEDGEEALAFLRREGQYADAARPDLILLDLNLPKKDGRQVLTEIKADADLSSIPVVVLTTSAAEEDIIRSYQLHANCYVTKPVGLEEFISIIKLIKSFWLAAVKLPPNGS